MTIKQKNVWEAIYHNMMEISKWQPWRDFSEEIPFVYETMGGKQKIYFTLFGRNSKIKGICCYSDIDYYISARTYRDITETNEPDMLLQNALVGTWVDNGEVSNANKELIKELGLKFRGKGGWLQFEAYELQYTPRSLNEKEAEQLADALDHFRMMMEAYYLGGFQIDFRENGIFVRSYDKKNKLWTNTWKMSDTQLDGVAPRIEIQPNDMLTEMKQLPTKKYTMELDEMLLPMPQKVKGEKGRRYFPMLFIAVDSSKKKPIGMVETTQEENSTVTLYNTLYDLIKKKGKPKQINVCNPILAGKIDDFCKQIGVKLTYSPNECEVIKELVMDILSDIEEEMSGDISQGREEPPRNKAIKFPVPDNGKSFVISVSLGTGCYRHIRIGQGETLERLHEAILDAFCFDDDHAHAFFLDNRAWSRIAEYVSCYLEDAERCTNEYRLCEVLRMGQKFLYIFDFGEEWCFSCKVLRELDEPTAKPQVVRVSGEAPEQYGGY